MDTRQRRKRIIRTALIAGAVALAFFLLSVARLWS
jgi:hypothetical protein